MMAMINRTFKDDPTEYGTKREKEGRQEKRREDNTSGLKLAETFRKAENREEWTKVVDRSSVMSQRSPMLRDL